MPTSHSPTPLLPLNSDQPFPQPPLPQLLIPAPAICNHIPAITPPHSSTSLSPLPSPSLPPHHRPNIPSLSPSPPKSLHRRHWLNIPSPISKTPQPTPSCTTLTAPPSVFTSSTATLRQQTTTPPAAPPTQPTTATTFPSSPLHRHSSSIPPPSTPAFNLHRKSPVDRDCRRPTDGPPPSSPHPNRPLILHKSAQWSSQWGVFILQ